MSNLLDKIDRRLVIRFKPYKPKDSNCMVIPITGYRQLQSYTCGYCCALMASRYFVPGISSDKLYRLIGIDHDGVCASGLIRGLRKTGMSVGKLYNLSFGKIRNAIDKNKLLIIGVKRDHWVLVYGYGVKPNRIFVADPSFFRQTAYNWCEFRKQVYLNEPTIVISKLK